MSYCLEKRGSWILVPFLAHCLAQAHFLLEGQRLQYISASAILLPLLLQANARGTRGPSFSCPP